VRDVEYQHQAGKTWLARVYQPKGTGPFPTIVDVHGGAWHNGDRTNNAGIDRALAAKGVGWRLSISTSRRRRFQLRVNIATLLGDRR